MLSSSDNGDGGIGSLTGSGTWTIYSGSDTSQTSYDIQVNQLNGINLNASEGLSSGQKSTVLRASGDKQWIDTYGIFKRNRIPLLKMSKLIMETTVCLLVLSL